VSRARLGVIRGPGPGLYASRMDWMEDRWPDIGVGAAVVGGLLGFPEDMQVRLRQLQDR
jgi:hypothetical protein